MAYHVEVRGLEIESRENLFVPYVEQSSVELVTAIAERATGKLAIRQPPGSSFSAPVILVDQDGHLMVDEAAHLLVTRPESGPPRDFDEVTIDYPHRPYRAEALRTGSLIAYWPLDDAAVVQALDLKGTVPLAVRAGNATHFRAYRQETSAVPYGGAIEFTHAAGTGLSGALPIVGSSFTVAGFVRLKSPATGTRVVWDVFTHSLSLDHAGLLTLSMDGQILLASGVTQDVWHHVAVVRTPTTLELWLDGVRATATAIVVSTSPLDGGTFDMAVAEAGHAVNLALDEWGIWGQTVDVADLVERRMHVRKFGGYIFGLVDATEFGPTDTHVYKCNLAGYGLRLDYEFVRHTYASASGSTVRQIVHDVLVRAGLQHEFTSHGVEIEDTVLREVYPVLSVMEILRKLANAHGAIVTADEWKEIDMVRRANIEHSALVLRGGRGGNVRAIGRSTEPRFYGNSAIVVGRGQRGTVEETHVTDGVTRRYDAGQPIGDVLSITFDGVKELFGAGDRWTIDTKQQRFELADGEIPGLAGKKLKFSYVSDESMVVTADDTAAIAAIGFRLAKRYEDDTIDNVSLARTLSAARLDRHNQLFEEYVAISLPGEITRLRPGVAPVWEFPRHKLPGVRLLVEQVSERSVSGGAGFHPVELTIVGTALDYQGGVGDDYRSSLEYRPPAPRPGTGVAADPNQIIIRPTDVAIPVSLPIRLGGSLSAPTTTAAWTTPDGAVLTRVSGHQIAVPLALSFMARCLPPQGVLGAGQGVEVRLWDATTGVAIGSAVHVDTTSQGGSRGVLRGVRLPLRDFDLTYQCRALAGLRAGIVWGVTLHLDLGG